MLVVSRDKFLLFSVLKVVFVLIIIIIIIFFKSCARVFVIYFVYEPKITLKNKKKLIVEKLLLVHFNFFFSIINFNLSLAIELNNLACMLFGKSCLALLDKVRGAN